MMSPISLRKTISTRTISGLSIVSAAAVVISMTAFSNAQEVIPTPAFSPPVPGDLNLPPVQEADIESELLTRGPVHEAYAEQYSDDFLEGIVVDKQPPELIEELPPEEMPDGKNVEWIPGYWAWEEDLDDFIWISGLWRDMPVGQRWVPGYWAEVDGGFRWVPGFWTSDDTEELIYLPEPPASLEQGPNVSAPSDNHFWVPGTWVYQTNNYAWQPGYWSPSYDDYVWMPARYQYTPRGHIYCSGYWDYPISRRGVLFTPVHFRNRRIPYRYRGYRYRPRLVVSAGPLLVHLFVRPRYRHYYFGDYYAARYRDRGIYPFTQQNRYARRGYSYDPLRTYYQVSSRRTTYNRLVDWNRYFDRNDAFRPPRTNSLTARFSERNRNVGNSVVIQQATLGSTIAALSDRRRPDHRTFHKISMSDRDQISTRVSKAVRDLTNGRHQFERIAGTQRGNDRNDLNRNNRGPNVGDRPNKGRDNRREEIVSLKLPEVNQFRDRLRSLSSSQGNRSERDFSRGSQGSPDRDQKRSWSPSDRANSKEDRDDSRRESQRLTPSDLRARIESARGTVSGKENRSESSNSASRTRSESNSNAQRPTSSSKDRLAEIRERMEAAQKQQSGRPSTERGRDSGRDSSSRAGNTSSSSDRSTDLRSRIEAARRAAESRKSSSESQGRSTSGETPKRATPTGTSRSGSSTGSSSSDIRARIEAARKAAESQRAKQTETNPSGQTTTGSESRNRPTTKPSTRSTSTPSTSGTDLRSRIEAARKAAESQRAKRTETNRPGQTTTGSESRNRPTTKPSTRSSSTPNTSGTDLRSRIEAARKAADRQRALRESQNSSSRSNERAKPTAKPPVRESRSTSSSASDIRARIEAARKSAESRSSSSNRSRSGSASSSSSKAASDARARIEAMRRSREASQRQSRTPAASSRDQRSRVEPQRSSSTPKVEPRRSSPSRSSIQDSIKSARSRIESRSSSSSKARSSTPSRSSRSSGSSSRGSSRERSKGGKK